LIDLRARGLSSRALAAWAVPRLSALPYIVPKLPPGQTLLDLFVAGRDVAAGLDLGDLGDLVDARGRARVAILPLGDSLLVCDRLDAPTTPDLVCWPDDSSYHLAQSLPRGPHASWIDLGCGSAFAPLYRPGLAARIDGTDLNPRAVDFAQLGAQLSGLAHFTAHAGDLDAGLSHRAELVTCNAPIPDEHGPIWRATDGGFVTRLYDSAARRVAPGGMVVVHAAEAALAPVVTALPGERVLVTYTPPGVPGFAVAWWRPDARNRLLVTRRDLTEQHPHLTFHDYEAAIAS
jgi:methylase of polypeptide subunit release factors